MNIRACLVADSLLENVEHCSIEILMVQGNWLGYDCEGWSIKLSTIVIININLFLTNSSSQLACAKLFSSFRNSYYTSSTMISVRLFGCSAALHEGTLREPCGTDYGPKEIVYMYTHYHSTFPWRIK